MEENESSVFYDSLENLVTAANMHYDNTPIGETPSALTCEISPNTSAVRVHLLVSIIKGVNTIQMEIMENRVFLTLNWLYPRV